MLSAPTQEKVKAAAKILSAVPLPASGMSMGQFVEISDAAVTLLSQADGIDPESMKRHNREVLRQIENQPLIMNDLIGGP